MESLEQRFLLSNIKTPQFTLKPFQVQQRNINIPNSIRTSYNTPSTATGQGRVISIIIAGHSPTIREDTDKFAKTVGLGSYQLVVAQPFGQPFVAEIGWQIEASLDVQYSLATAPKAKIILVEALSASSFHMFNAVEWAAKRSHIVNMSFGIPEKFFYSYFYEETIFKHYNKTLFVAASGDTARDIYYPASASNVLSVGGTTLRNTLSGRYLGESLWSLSSRGISDDKKRIPDVGAVGDPKTGVLVVHNGAFYKVGGTSLSAPLWAGWAANLENVTGRRYNAETLKKDISKYKDAFHHVKGTGLGTPIYQKLANYLAREYRKLTIKLQPNPLFIKL